MNPAQLSTPTDISTQLEQLRDIRLPDEISWWPIADGWWLLAIVTVLAIAITSLLIVRRRRSLRFNALRELQLLRNDEKLQRRPLMVAERAGELLKRIVLRNPDDQSSASLSGDKWSQVLAEEPGAMDSTVAEFIAVAPYVSEQTETSAPSVVTILDATESWIRRVA